MMDESAKPLLQGPPEYFAADDLERFKICNGCGSAQAKFDFVPDNIWGVPTGEACDIHDWRYHFGRTEQDRLEADRELQDNLMTLVEEHARRRLSQMQGWRNAPRRALENAKLIARRYRVATYYGSVRDLGGKAFWAGKQRG